MRIYDITVPVSPSLPVYPGDPEVVSTPVAQLPWVHPANVSRLARSSQAGTHLDAPRHFFQDGITIDRIDPQVLIGPARVWAFPDAAAHLTADDLRPLDVAGTPRVLFKTPNSALWAR